MLWVRVGAGRGASLRKQQTGLVVLKWVRVFQAQHNEVKWVKWLVPATGSTSKSTQAARRSGGHVAKVNDGHWSSLGRAVLGSGPRRRMRDKTGAI